MPKLSRVGDRNTTGGSIIRGAKTVFANGIRVGLHISLITPHLPWKKHIHKVAATNSASPSVFAEGRPVLRVGSGNTCGHQIITGSSNVFVP